MSYDRKIYDGDQYHKCPHEVVSEPLYVTDYSTAVLAKPVSSLSTVKVRLNGLLAAAPTGTYAAAATFSNKKGPYTLLAPQEVNLHYEGPHRRYDVTWVYPTIGRIPAPLLVRVLNEAFVDLYFSVTDRGFLRVEAKLASPDVSFSLSGALVETLGFTPGRIHRGVQLAPGWSITSVVGSLQESDQRRVLVFDSPLRGFADFVEVDYTTAVNYCRRCGGQGVEQDWRYDVNSGYVQEVRNEALLLQELVKITMTTKGSNPAHPGYGSQLTNLIGQKGASRSLVRTFLANEAQQVFQTWQNVKRRLEQSPGFPPFPDREYPYRLVDVSVVEDPRDPTRLYLSLSVQSRALGSIIKIKKGLQVGL